MNTLEYQDQALNVEQVERNKDKLDLKPNLDFVSRHQERFEEGLDAILKRAPTQEAREWVKRIEFSGTEDIVEPQVSPEDVREILSRMPEALIELSDLETVNYHLFGLGKHLLPIPGYDAQGNLDQSSVAAVEVKNFPRKKSKQCMTYRWRKDSSNKWKFTGENEVTEEDDHPSRLLVGVSNGKIIYPTPIPKSVSKDERAIFIYQIHLLLHEFFHTIDYLRRDPKIRANIVLGVDGQRFTFQDWWKDFEELILSKEEPACVSSYANTYANDLNRETAEKEYQKFTNALAEQVCESFVAYELGIISNDDRWTDFKSESFGNTAQKTKFQQNQATSANLKWFLMDKLCRAKVVK